MCVSVVPNTVEVFETLVDDGASVVVVPDGRQIDAGKFRRERPTMPTSGTRRPGPKKHIPGHTIKTRS